MSNTTNIQKYLGKRGLQGPIFLVDSLTGTPLLDDDTLQPMVITRTASGTTAPVNGFYTVKSLVDDTDFSAQIVISGWRSRTRFLQNPDAPQLRFTYTIDDSDEVLDDLGNVISGGTFSRYFDRDVVKTIGNYEQMSGMDLVKTFDGTSPFQRTFPVSFASFTNVQITQANINSAKQSTI